MARYHKQSDFYDIAYNAVYSFLTENANNELYEIDRLYPDMTDYVISNIDIIISDYISLNIDAIARVIAFGLRDIIDCIDDTDNVVGLLYSKDLGTILKKVVREYIIQYLYDVVVDWCTDNDF